MEFERQLFQLDQKLKSLQIMKTIKLTTIFPQASKEVHHDDNSYNTFQHQFPLLDQATGCNYINEVSIENILKDVEIPKKIKIMNQLCREQKNTLQKVTTIKLGNKIITLKDQYYFNGMGKTLVFDDNKKRIQFFKKPVRIDQEGSFGKSRLTKNLPKNFIKAFINYLEDLRENQNVELIQCKIKLLLSKQKFNNSFIQRIIDDDLLQSYFKDFLRNKAQQWIKESKITNKKVHLEAIQIFLGLTKTQQNQKKIQSTISFSNSYQSSKQSGQFFINKNLGQAIENIESCRDSILANQSRSYGFEQN